MAQKNIEVQYPKISIITVCYNSEKTIARTIQSVLEQKYENIEYIIIDGASKDGTLDIVNSFKKETGYPHILVSERDSGIYDAMNKGIRKASGDLICMLNSDDWLEKDALQRVAEVYSGEEYKVIYGLERRVREGREISVGYHSHRDIEHGNIPHQTCYVTKKTYEKYGLYDVNYKSSADYEFMLRVAKSNEVKFEALCAVLVNFTEGGLSSNAIGFIEEAAIKYRYGLIAKKRYWYLRLRVTFLKMMGQLK